MAAKSKTETARGVRFQTRWTADASLFNVKTEPGLWLDGRADESGPSEEGVSEVDCVDRGSMQYVGLAVKYLDDHHAYVVTPEGPHRQTSEQNTWRWPSAAVGPGLHFVDVAFRSRDGGSAIVRLTVMNPGRGARLKANLLLGQLAT